MINDDKSLPRAFVEISAGLPAFVHAENSQVIDYCTETLKKEGRKYSLASNESGPEIAETDAIFRTALLAKKCGVKLHIAHMSARKRD